MPCCGHRWEKLPDSPGCPNKELASKCFSSAGILFGWIWDGTQNVKYKPTEGPANGQSVTSKLLPGLLPGSG